MIDLKLLNLNYGDSQKDLSDKLNYNFSQILSAGEGSYGSIGDVGPIGVNGDLGITGPQGDQGFRGSVWFVQSSDPSSGATGGDYWVDTLNGFEVYRYTYSSGSYSWVSQGFVLAQSGVFTVATSQTGLTSDNPDSAYVQGLFDPEKRTLVLTDQAQENVKNSQLSKVVIGNSGTGASGAYPLLEFSKIDYQSNPDFNLRTPRFRWYSVNPALFSTYGYSMKLWSNNGLSINSNGLRFTGSFDLQSGDGGNATWGGMTGDFSGEISHTAAGGFTLQPGATSSDYPISWRVESANVTLWNNYDLSANTSFTASYTGNQATFQVTDGLVYTRKKTYVTGENVLRMKYTGNSSFANGGVTVSQLALDRDLYLVDSDGNNKYSKKISGFFPNPGISGASQTGNFTHPAGNGNYYTVLAAMDTSTTGSGKTYRFSIGDTYFMDYDGTSISRRALGVFLDGTISTFSKIGLATLNAPDLSSGASYTFKVIAPNAANGFNAIFLDSVSGQNFPSTTTKNFTDSNTVFNFIDGDSNPNVYATTVEVTVVFENFVGNIWKIYWKAYGGNLDGIKCGCVSTI
jgi:hypothetical protein